MCVSCMRERKRDKKKEKACVCKRKRKSERKRDWEREGIKNEKESGGTGEKTENVRLCVCAIVSRSEPTCFRDV